MLLEVPGQGGDAAMFTRLMDQLKINPILAGHARVRTVSAVTRPARSWRSGPTFATAALWCHPASQPIRLVIENGVDLPEADLLPSTRRTTSA